MADSIRVVVRRAFSGETAVVKIESSDAMPALRIKAASALFGPPCSSWLERTELVVDGRVLQDDELDAVGALGRGVDGAGVDVVRSEIRIKAVLTDDEDGYIVEIVDVDSGAPLRKFHYETEQEIAGDLKLAPSKDAVALALDTWLSLWLLPSGKHLCKLWVSDLSGRDDFVDSMDFSPSGNVLVGTSRQGYIGVFDVKSGAKLYSGPLGSFNYTDFSSIGFRSQVQPRNIMQAFGVSDFVESSGSVQPSLARTSREVVISNPVAPVEVAKDDSSLLQNTSECRSAELDDDKVKLLNALEQSEQEFEAQEFAAAISGSLLMHKVESLPVSAEGVVIFRLTRNGEGVAEALQSSPHLAVCHRRVEEAGCELSPDFAHGAKLLIPLTSDQFAELQLRLGPHHILAMREDREAIQQALMAVPSRKRPQVRTDHRATMVFSGNAPSCSTQPTQTQHIEANAAYENQDERRIEVIEERTIEGDLIRRILCINGIDINAVKSQVSEESRVVASAPDCNTGDEMTVSKRQKNHRVFKCRSP